MSVIGAVVADARTAALIDDLRALPAESAWVEFKENNAGPQIIGKLISSLSNAARLADQHFAYVLWGVRDRDHAAVGTSFDPGTNRSKGSHSTFGSPSDCSRVSPSLSRP